jgi:hypothetical protein
MSTGSVGVYSASRLTAYCSGLIEACWLAAVAIVPLLYNPHSLNGFDPAKIDLLRLLAALTLAAWTIGIVDGPGIRTQTLMLVKRLWRSRIAIPLGLLLLSYLAANCFSIYPSISFWGTYDYFQGTFTFLCLLVLFGAVATFLRRAEQVQRLIVSILATSFPIAVYAIVQQIGFDPQLFEDAAAGIERSFSLLGHPNYLGAYLGFVLPLTIFRLIQIVRTGRAANRASAASLFFRLSVYLVVAAAQVGALLCTQSRGALLGAGAAVFSFGLLVAARNGRRRIAVAAMVLTFAAAGFVLVLNLPNGPLKTLRTVSVFDRLGQMLPLGRGIEESSSMRSTVWGLAPRIMFPRGSWLIAGRGTDPVYMLRPVVGYGPETLAAVMRHYLVQPDARWDRFHNLVLDTWFAVGIGGVVGILWLFVELFFVGLKSLQITQSPGDRRMFLLLVSSCLIAGGAAPAAFGTPGFVGLGLQFGLVVAVAIFLLLKTLHPGAAAVSKGGWNSAAVVMVILAALAGHIVESSFSFAVAETLAFFWIYAGALVALVGSADGAGWRALCAGENVPSLENRRIATLIGNMGTGTDSGCFRPTAGDRLFRRSFVIFFPWRFHLRGACGSERGKPLEAGLPGLRGFGRYRTDCILHPGAEANAGRLVSALGRNLAANRQRKTGAWDPTPRHQVGARHFGIPSTPCAELDLSGRKAPQP